MKKWWEYMLNKSQKIVEMECFDGLPSEVKDEILWLRDTAYTALHNEEWLPIELSNSKKVWFYESPKDLHEGFIDGIEFSRIGGWKVYVRDRTTAIEHWDTARIFEYSLKDYGTKFALTKEELK